MLANNDILVYGPAADDFETEGLCGPLYAYEAHVIEGAGDDYRLEFQHPYDDEGCWRYLAVGMILRCWVLMRTPPAIDDLGGHVTSVEIWRVKSTATKAQRYLHSKQGSRKDKKLKLLPAGAEVVVTLRPATGRVRCSTKWGAGWMDPAALDYEISTDVPDTGDGMEAVLPGAQLRPQLFEIYSVEMQLEGVTVYARHVTYQLMKNLTTFRTTASVTLQDALRGILEGCADEHEFQAYSDLLDARTGVDWTRVNPIEAMLDPEEGCVGRWPCEVLRDNYDLFFLEKVGVDRGVTIELGKNLSGITITTDMSGVATHLMPVGTKADGTPLMLPETWIVSDHAGDYAQKHIYCFDAEDAQVGSGTTEAQALSNMRAQCARMLASGCDRPALTINVSVAQVDAAEAAGEDVSEQRQIIAMLEPLLVYDLVHVYFRGYGYDEVVVERDWDPVHARLNSCTLGVAAGSMGSVQVATWQIPSGLDGQKIAPGSLGPAQLGEETIAARHIQAGTISADKIAAGVIAAESITAVTAAIQTIAAQSVTTNELDAAYADIFSLIAQQISGTTVEADTLEAAIANLVSVTGTSAKFEIEDVQHLIGKVIQATVLTSGLARIENLYVTQANLMNATLDRLTLLAADGETYYDVSVGTDGSLIATERDPSSVDPASGTTTDGRNVLDASEMEADTGMDVPDLDGLTAMLAEDGLLWVYTQGLSTGKLRATEAFIGSGRIDSLQTTAVEAVGNSMTFSANQVIQMLVGVAEDVQAWYTFGDDGLRTRKAGSKWSTLVDDTGFHIDHDNVIGHVGSFHNETLEVRSQSIGDLKVIPSEPGLTGGWVWVDR